MRHWVEVMRGMCSEGSTGQAWLWQPRCRGSWRLAHQHGSSGEHSRRPGLTVVHPEVRQEEALPLAFLSHKGALVLVSGEVAHIFALKHLQG